MEAQSVLIHICLGLIMAKARLMRLTDWGLHTHARTHSRRQDGKRVETLNGAPSSSSGGSSSVWLPGTLIQSGQSGVWTEGEREGGD